MAACSILQGPTNGQGQTFSSFYAQLRRQAQAKGYNPADLDAAFKGKPAPLFSVTKAEGNQPELVRTFEDYVGAMLSSTRIAQGRQNMELHADQLKAAAAKTGVSPSVIVALWGVETNFGKSQGTQPVIPALVTLAWQSPRSSYFRTEVFKALKVADQTGTPTAQLKGSWAGAMGQCQFMPSSYLAYAVDGDNDGKVDIWNNTADVFASTANFLRAKGDWQSGQAWRLPAGHINLGGLKLNNRGLSSAYPLSDWEARGFILPKDIRGYTEGSKLRYYRPEQGGPAYLLGSNFDAILKWNNSSYFAFSVLSLADILAQEEGQGGS